MDRKAHATEVIFSAVNSGIVLGGILGLFFTGLLYVRYSANFPELSLLKIALFFISRLVFYTAGLSIILGILVIVISFLSKRTRNIKKRFAVFFSFLFALYFCFWMELYLNAFILRYSRELKSYLADLLLIFCGVILFVVLYKVMPTSRANILKKSLKIISLFVFLASMGISYTINPFSFNTFVGQENTGVKRNYDSYGKYLRSMEHLTPNKLNVILFSIDTLRADGLSCYGNPRVTSPNIDWLASEGILFKNTVVQSSWTLPSHMTMVTSLMPSIHGCKSSQLWINIGESLKEYRITLAEILKNFGYSTGAFTGGALLGPEFNFDQGFDVCDASGGGISKISKKALTWLEDNYSDGSFFLFLHCYDVHQYKASKAIEEKFVKPYAGKLLELKKQGGPLTNRVTSNGFYSLSEQDVQFLRDLYDATIFHTDNVFGDVLSFLKDHSLYENTVIIVTSDHGEEFWEHGGTGHGWSLHQHQLKVPLIVKSPTLDQPGRSIDDWVGIIDLPPTILDILGIPLSNEFQGISLLPLLSKGDHQARTFAAEASHWGNQKCLIRDGYSYLFDQYPPIGEDLFYWKRFIRTWRIIMNYSANELYDLEKDPEEGQNILSENPNLEKDMRSNLLKRIRDNLALKISGPMANIFELDKKTKKELESLGYIK